MAEAVLTSKGQVTIPKDIREALRLENGDRLDFIREQGWIIMVPLKGSVLDLYGAVPRQGRQLNFKKLREQVKREVAKRSAR